MYQVNIVLCGDISVTNQVSLSVTCQVIISVIVSVSIIDSCFIFNL